jgi:hypothetical protein
MKITVDKNSAIPYYVQVKEGVKALIGRVDEPGICSPQSSGRAKNCISRLVVQFFIVSLSPKDS